MNKPNNSNESLSQRFTEIQQNLKAVHEALDFIQSQPYIPSIRQNDLAFLSDKTENLQANMHSMQMMLAHLG